MAAKLKIIASIVLLFFAVIQRPPQAHAAALLLIDAHSGEVLFEDLAGNLWHPASLTKMMTLYVALESIRDKKINMRSRVYISKNATRQPPSKIGFRPGVKIPLQEALEGMFIRSANDLAVAIAEHVGGTEQNFVIKMNKTARRLGMDSTSFANPHGLPDDRQITTARDMAILGRALLREFPEADTLYTAHYAKVRGRKYRSRNLGLLKGFRGADGIKTGYVCASGYNLAASATRDGRQLIAVVLGGTSTGQRNGRVIDLLARGFSDKLRASSLKPRFVEDIQNKKKSMLMPPDFTRRLCKHKGLEVVKGYQLKNYSVVVGHYQSLKTAQKNLRDELIGIRDVVHAGRGAVMRGVGGMASAVITDLQKEDVPETCLQLFQNMGECIIIKPGTYKRPPAPIKPATDEKKNAVTKPDGEEKEKPKSSVKEPPSTS